MARVLIVDDDNDIRSTLRLLLQDAGHEVSEAANGPAAITVLRQDPQPLIVLLDLLMPEMGGVAVLRDLYLDSANARRHAYIIMSADPNPLPPDAIQVAADLKVSNVPKPFDVDTMLAAIERAAKTLGCDGD